MGDLEKEEKTAEEKAADERFPESVRLIKSLLDSTQRRSLIWQFAKIMLGAAVVPVVLFLPHMIGGMLALGTGSWLRENTHILPRVLLIGPGLIIGLFAILYPLELVFWCLSLGFKKALVGFSPRYAGQISKAVKNAFGAALLLTIVGIAVYQCGSEGYQAGLQQVPNPVKEADQKTITETREAAARQQEAVKKFSETAQVLLGDLDRTALKVAEAKREIAETMLLFDRQIEAAQVAQANLSKLAEKQRAIQSRAEELDRILQGKRPITQEDMDRSARDNLWQGLVMGVLTSLFATFIYPRLGRLGALLGKKKPDESGAAS